MAYQIKNRPFLRRILWFDFACGFSTAAVGLPLLDEMVTFLGLPYSYVLWVSLVSLAYSLLALGLARMKNTSISLLQTLIYANWAWTLVSVVLFYFHFQGATAFGQVLLIVQIVVAGGLAWVEGKQLVKVAP